LFDLAGKSRGQQLVLGHISRMYLANGVSLLVQVRILLFASCCTLAKTKVDAFHKSCNVACSLTVYVSTSREVCFCTI